MFYTDQETERLILKNIDSEDRAFIFSHFSNQDVTAFLFDAEPLMDFSGADEIIDFYLVPEPRPQHRWIIQRKTDGLKMGTCGFHCWSTQNAKVEIGYDLAKAFWGNGFMGESLKTIIGFAQHQMKVKEIEACISVDNRKSICLVEKLGFVLSGSKYEVFRGKKYLHNVYTLYLESV